MFLRFLLGSILNISLWQTPLGNCDSGLNTRIFSYFAAKNVYSVDAVMCSTKESFQILRCVEKNSSNGFIGFFRASQTLSTEKPSVEVHSGIFMDLRCEKNRRLLSEVSEDWFTYNFIWFLWDPEDDLGALKYTLPLSTFSQVGHANWNRVSRLYKQRRMLPLESYEECQWDEETKHFTFTKAIFVVNFYGTPITAALMVIQDVYNDSLLVQQLQDASHAPGKDVSNRFVYAVTGHIAQLFNFSVELIMTGDWGDRFENGSFNGLMGMIQEEKADVTVSILLPLPERATVAFPAILSLPYWTVVAFKQPRALGTYRAMILELSPGCWVLVGCVVILGAGVLAFTIKHGKEPRVKSDIPFSVGLLQSVGIMTNQGLMYLPEGNSCRTASLTMLMVGMMVLIYYNAATMTALLSESPPPIKNLEALIQSKIPFVSADAPYITILPARKKVFDDIVLARMTETMKICSEEEGIPLILNGSAFIGEHRGIFYAVNNLLKTDTICDLTMFRTGVRTTNPVFTRRCPHLREMYLRGQLRSLEHGVWQREKISWIPGWPTCTPVAKFVHVQLEAVSVALGLLLFGAWFSTMFLILEIYLHKRSIRLTSIVMLPK